MRDKFFVRKNTNRIRMEADSEYIIMNDCGVILKLNELGKEILDLCNGKNTKKVLLSIFKLSTQLNTLW